MHRVTGKNIARRGAKFGVEYAKNQRGGASLSGFGSEQAKDRRGVFGHDAFDGYVGMPVSTRSVTRLRVDPSSAFTGYSGGPPIFGADDTTATVQSVQTALNTAGYGPLTVDGQLGSQTSAAIKAFQIAKSINPTGAIDDTTLTALGLVPTGVPIQPNTLFSRIKAVFAPPPAPGSVPSTTTPTTPTGIAGFFERLKAVFVPAAPPPPPPPGS